MHVVVSTYHETSINKKIQYSSKRVINYINITKNWENNLQNTKKACKITLIYLHMTFDFAIFKLETDKGIKTQKKTLKHWPIPKTYLKPPDLPNLIKSSGPGTNFEVWPKIDQV